MNGYFLQDYSELASTPASAPWWSLTFDLVVKLGLVIGLIYLTMWALRTYVLGPQVRARGATRFTGRFDVLDSTALAPNRQIYLVEVADRVLVLGATSGSLATLAEIREPEAIDLLKKKSADEPGGAASFADQLRSLTDHLPVATPSSFLGDKIGELRALAAHLRR